MLQMKLGSPKKGVTLLSSQGGWRNPDSLTSSTQESRLYKI